MSDEARTNIVPPDSELGLTPAGADELGGYVRDEERRAAEAKQVVAAQVAAAERAGTAMHKLFEEVGSKLESGGEQKDELSDLFEGPDMEKDNDVYIKDLVTVDEEDVFGEGGEDMSDLLEVDEEDIMGEEEEEPSPPPRPVVQSTRRLLPRRSSSVRKPPPDGLAGLQY